MKATAYILVGPFSTTPGEGVQPPQRAHALTEYLGRPLLYHQLDALRRHGIRHVVICTAPGVLPHNLPGETYRDSENPNTFLVISVWFGLLDWRRWYNSDERRDESHWVIGHAAVVKRFLRSQE